MAGRIDYLAGRIDYMASRIDYLAARIDYLAGRIDYLAGRIDYLAGRIKGRIEGIKVDAQGNMRTLEVERRHRDRRTDCRPEHKGVEKDMLKVWVQRTALIMPVGEYGGDGCKESEIDAWTVMTAGVGMSLKS